MDDWVALIPSCSVPFIQVILSYQVLYPILPALLDCNPFRESPDLQVTGEGARVLGSSGLQVPSEIEQVVEVLTETRRLLSDCQLHPEISSQLIAYLFYFINASLFNSLMERGTNAYNTYINSSLHITVAAYKTPLRHAPLSVKVMAVNVSLLRMQ